MDKKTEALKLAQNWYDSGNENPDDFADMIKKVIALAEQPAQQRPQNCGTGYCSCIECLFEQPAQRKPLTDEEIEQWVYLLIVQTPLGLRWKEPEVKHVYANKKKAKEEAARLQKSPQFRGHAWVISKKVK